MEDEVINSASEDLKLIDSLMTIIDPGTTARGDFKGGRGFFGSLVSLREQVAKGQKLTPGIKKALAEKGMSLVDGMSPEMMDSNSAVRAGEMSEMMGSSPVSDYQAAVEFAKTIDPGTFAREGEAAAIAGANLPADQKQMLLNVLNGTGKMQEMMGTYQVDDGTMQMTPSQMKAMQESGAITPDAGRVMSMDDAIAAGLVNPTRPKARPSAPMQSMRPQARPMR